MHNSPSEAGSFEMIILYINYHRNKQAGATSTHPVVRVQHCGAHTVPTSDIWGFTALWTMRERDC